MTQAAVQPPGLLTLAWAPHLKQSGGAGCPGGWGDRDFLRKGLCPELPGPAGRTCLTSRWRDSLPRLVCCLQVSGLLWPGPPPSLTSRSPAWSQASSPTTSEAAAKGQPGWLQAQLSPTTSACPLSSPSDQVTRYRPCPPSTLCPVLSEEVASPPLCPRLLTEAHSLSKACGFLQTGYQGHWRCWHCGNLGRDYARPGQAPHTGSLTSSKSVL